MKKSRIAAIASSLALGSVLALTGAGAAHADQANQEWWGATNSDGSFNYYLGNSSGGGGYYGNIHNFNAPGSMCLDADGWSLNGYHNAPVQLWNCWGGTNQWWTQVDNHDGTWSFYATRANDYYDYKWWLTAFTNGGGIGSGTGVQAQAVITNWDDDAHQRWTIGRSGQLVNAYDDTECLDAANWGTGNGTVIQTWTCAW